VCDTRQDLVAYFTWKQVWLGFLRSFTYLDKCLEIITLFDDFTVQHVSRDENIVVNDLAQQASGF
jgi:hypothetical protein